MLVYPLWQTSTAYMNSLHWDVFTSFHRYPNVLYKSHVKLFLINQKDKWVDLTYLFPLKSWVFLIIYCLGYFSELLLNLPYIKKGTGYWSFCNVDLTNGQEKTIQTCVIIFCHEPSIKKKKKKSMTSPS